MEGITIKRMRHSKCAILLPGLPLFTSLGNGSLQAFVFLQGFARLEAKR